MATISELMEGKKPGEIKIRLDTFLKGHYFIPYFQAEYDNWHGVLCDTRDTIHAHYYGVYSEGWELYTEPNPKVLMAQYLMQNMITGRPFLSTEYFRDGTEAAAAFGSYSRVLGRAVETEREFEE